MEVFNRSGFEMFLALLLTLVLVLVIVAIAREAWSAYRSSSSYKKGFAEMQSTFADSYNKANHHFKKALFAKLEEGLKNVSGDVLELAIGAGSNLEFFPSGTSLIALDSNPHMEKLLKMNLVKYPHVCLKTFLAGNVLDGVKIEDNSIAAVVCTKLLCNLTDEEAMKILKEVKRILKPGGRFIFLEHVADKQGTFRRRLQNVLTWSGYWPSMYDGCMCNRESWHVLHQAGFRTLSYEKFLCVRPDSGRFLYKHFLFYCVAPSIMGYAEV